MTHDKHHHATEKTTREELVELPQQRHGGALAAVHVAPLSFACVDFNEWLTATLPLELGYHYNSETATTEIKSDTASVAIAKQHHQQQQQPQQQPAIKVNAAAVNNNNKADGDLETGVAAAAAGCTGKSNDTVNDDDVDLQEAESHELDLQTVNVSKDIVTHACCDIKDSHTACDLEAANDDEDNSCSKSANMVDPLQRNSSLLKRTIMSVYSALLLAFCVAMITAAIFTEQTRATVAGTHPIVAYGAFWAVLIWLALIEGGLNTMVGLKPIDNTLYAETHRLTYWCSKLAHRGDNLDRFIIGRQFLDLSCLFVINFLAMTVKGAAVFGLPHIVNEIFLRSGVAVIITTVIIGQLVSQINSAHCMIDFMNNYAMLTSTAAALVVEYSGLLHSVYLVQMLIAKLAGKKIESAEPPRNFFSNVFYWARVLFSTVLLIFAFVVTFKALFDGHTTMFEGVPPLASTAVFVFLIAVCAIIDGLQIALFAVINIPIEEVAKNPKAHKNCQLLFQGNNTESFLVGRQILQTIVMFGIARITSLRYAPADENIFGVSDSIQRCFNVGMMGALITTIVASLTWRVIASAFPICFLSIPFSTTTIRICLFLERTGIFEFAWIIAAVVQRVVNLQVDDVHINRALEQRKMDAKNLEESSTSDADASN